jgi:hypothetical protein
MADTPASVAILWITAGLGCDGDTIAMTAATPRSSSTPARFTGTFSRFAPACAYSKSRQRPGREWTRTLRICMRAGSNVVRM